MGPVLRPWWGAQACGLRGDGLPHQRARWFAMTGLGMQCVWRRVQRFRETDGGGSPPPGSCDLIGSLVPTHPVLTMHP